MNINFQRALDMITNLFATKSPLHARAIAQPVRDWKVILACMAVGIVLSAVAAGYVYINSSTDAQIAAQEAVPKSKLKSADIANVLTAVEARAAMHARFLAGDGGGTDPSR